MRLRILHISTRLIVGGSQENTVLSCEGQLARGHEVHLAYGPIYGPEGSMLDRVKRQSGKGAERQSGRGIDTHEVRHLVREVSAWADWRGYVELRRLIRAIGPDVVHTHSSKAGILGRAAAWAERGHASREGRPLGVVHTIHGPPFMPIAPGESVPRRVKTGVNNRVYEVAERFAAERCHVIVSVADAMTAEFLRRGIGRAGQYVTVYSGMETGRFLEAAPGEDRASVRKRLGLGERDFVIGTVARLAQHKGHDDLLDALGADLRTNAGWRLLWVGDGWWRERLEARLRAMGVRERAVLTGLVGPEAVPGLMRAMDVLVHPSKREGLPRTVPQAQLCGVMPIAYACDGAPEAIVSERLEDGAGASGAASTGVLVEVGDVAGLRRAVAWAAANAEARRAIGARGRVAAAARFSAEGMVAALEGVYARALAAAGGGVRGGGRGV